MLLPTETLKELLADRKRTNWGQNHESPRAQKESSSRQSIVLKAKWRSRTTDTCKFGYVELISYFGDSNFTVMCKGEQPDWTASNKVGFSSSLWGGGAGEERCLERFSFGLIFFWGGAEGKPSEIEHFLLRKIFHSQHAPFHKINHSTIQIYRLAIVKHNCATPRAR